MLYILLDESAQLQFYEFWFSLVRVENVIFSINRHQDKV